MRIRLLKRWGSRLPNQEVSVSVERARYLEESGIARAIDEYPEPEEPQAPPAKKDKKK